MTDTFRRVSLTAVTGLGLCLTLLPTGQAQAQAPAQAPIRVPCDVAALKRAIDDANTGGGRIVLTPRCIYSLTAADNADDGLPEITGNVRISGDGAVIQRSPRASDVFRIFHVRQSGSLTLDSLTLRGGRASPAPLLASNGGAVYNQRGRVTLNSVTVRNNSSTWLGGGIWNQLGTLTLKNTTVRDNESDNAGGVATNGTMRMRGGAISDNSAADWAGGLANGGDTKLNDVSLAGNLVGGGAGLFSQIGGGIMTMSIDNESGPLRLNASKVRSNTARLQGGGIFIGADEPTTLFKSVVTRNAANIGRGGGIWNGGSRHGIFTSPVAGPERTSRKSTKQAAQVNLIRSVVFKNTPDNCAPPNSVPRCDAVGSAPATSTPKPGTS
jgi:hypothetical protein